MVEQTISQRQRVNTTAEAGEKSQVRGLTHRKSQSAMAVVGEGLGLGVRLAGIKSKSVFGKRKTDGNQEHDGGSFDHGRRLPGGPASDDDDDGEGLDSPNCEGAETVNCVRFALTYSNKGGEYHECQLVLAVHKRFFVQTGQMRLLLTMSWNCHEFELVCGHFQKDDTNTYRHRHSLTSWTPIIL